MYGNNYGYYNQTRSIGSPTQPMSNPYMQQPNQMPINNYVQQPILPTQMSVPSTLQGKIVDNAEIVKVTDIPLDGSTSYFPLTDGSAIVTKQLQGDGTSRIVVYKPVIEENKDKEIEENKPKYVTESYFSEKIEKLDNSDVLNDLLDEIKNLRREIKDTKSTRYKDKER